MKPTAAVVCGLPTSGKTTLAREIARRTGLHLIDFDAGELFSTYPQEPNPYASEESKARETSRARIIYTVMHAAVEANLKEGRSLIITATYSRHASQDFLKAAVEHGGGRLKMALCKYGDTEAEIKRRIRSRSRKYRGGCRSLEHYLDDRARWAGIKLPHITVRMEGGERGTKQAVEEVLAYLNMD